MIAMASPFVMNPGTFAFVAPPAKHVSRSSDRCPGGHRLRRGRKASRRKSENVRLQPTATPQGKSDSPRVGDIEGGERGSIIPRHCAFICDGNARWARQRYLPDAIGHARGASTLIAVLGRLKERGVKFATFYGFSTENWSRPAAEIRDIWSVVEKTAVAFREKAMRERIRVKILGNLEDERVPANARNCLRALERDTSIFGTELSNGAFSADCNSSPASKTESLVCFPTGDANNGTGDKESEMTLCIAVNYGGRKDILNASLQIADDLSKGKIEAKDVDETTFQSYLYTSDVPEPDLCVRTGGERRLSNFLLWDLAYSELYFTDILWPDFDVNCVDSTLDWYIGRTRRYGGRETSTVQVSTEKK